MEAIQLELFADRPPNPSSAILAPGPPMAPETLSDAQVIAALPDALLAEACALAAEAGRRRLGEAVSALVALCRRFAGFGAQARVAEQISALEALSAIGGAEAARSVSQMIVMGVIQGPNLAAAVIVASGLGVKLPPEAALPLLRNANPAIRAAACGCVRASHEVVATLIDLLTDLNVEVSTAAACALGVLGHGEALAALKRCLTEKPSPRVIEALSAVADEEAIVFLSRVARKRPDLAPAAQKALADIEHPKAAVAAAGLATWLSHHRLEFRRATEQPDPAPQLKDISSD